MVDARAPTCVQSSQLLSPREWLLFGLPCAGARRGGCSWGAASVAWQLSHAPSQITWLAVCQSRRLNKSTASDIFAATDGSDAAIGLSLVYLVDARMSQSRKCFATIFAEIFVPINGQGSDDQPTSNTCENEHFCLIKQNRRAQKGVLNL